MKRNVPRVGSARIWDAMTGEEVALLAGHVGDVTCAVFSPDDRWVVIASRDGTARIWDSVTGREVITLSGHQSTVASAAFSPDGQRVVTASMDGTARIWEVDFL